MGYFFQELIFSKKNPSVLRFKLVAAHVAVNILENTRGTLHKYPIMSC